MLDARADIYALGAMIYFALTGQPPFVGTSPFQVMMAHARDPVSPPSKLRGDVPADLEQVVLCCLAKKPGDRYPDVKALGKALRGVRIGPALGRREGRRVVGGGRPVNPGTREGGDRRAGGHSVVRMTGIAAGS